MINVIEMIYKMQSLSINDKLTIKLPSEIKVFGDMVITLGNKAFEFFGDQEAIPATFVVKRIA